MAVIPQRVDPTLEAADAALEASQGDWKPRGYLGCSALGDPCERKLWYGFRWCTEPRIPAKGLKAIEDGHRGEQLQIIRLRMVEGLTLYTHDPNTRKQFGVEDVAGHVRGHLDGAIRGLLQAPKSWHVWEAKVVNEKKQHKLALLAAEHGEKAALAHWDGVYYAQAVLYMEYTGMTRHYLTVASPGGRETIGVRTNADPAEAAKLRAKASRIVAAPAPLSRVSDNDDYYWCNWCDHRGVCREQRLPPPTCRSCCHATPEMDGDGRWSCARHGRDVTAAEQFNGCDEHVYLPSLVTFAEQVDADEAANRVGYVLPDGRRFANGPRADDSFGSVELFALQREGLENAHGHEGLAMLRREFDAGVGRYEAA